MVLLKDENEVVLSYRKDKFARLKPKNKEKILEATNDNSVDIIYNSNLVSLENKSALIKTDVDNALKQIENDLVYIFAGGELPTAFLQKAGVEITKRHGHVVKKY